jgi:rhodanese-related sulfurtransferase/glyoxylase-like metal-dependent hydrolase (beta-lactamase superfamily II)
VSGHLDLAAKTGATIVYGPSTVTKYPVHVAKDLEIFKLGNISIQVLHTPGHTLESSCYLLKDEEGNNKAVFTGDTLFVGDVGRPDLAQKSNELTMNDLAGMLYDSLQEKIMPLADDVVVYPAHGAGSSCGKNLGADSYSTIGVQKASNYALQAESKETFIKAVTEGLNAPPAYFPINAHINKEGYTSLDSILANSMHPLSVKDFKEKLADNTIILDTRHPDQFMQGFVPGSINIGLNGRFAEWAGTLLPFTQPIVLVTEAGAEKESIVRLTRVGIEKIEGYLSGGFALWQDAGENIDMIIDVEADELAMDLPFDENLVIVDVRRETEYVNEHVKEAINIPLDQLTDPGSMANLDDHHNIYIHCASGYRSVIAASMIKRQGIHNIRNVVGGIEAIKGLPEKFEFEKETAALN